MVSAINSNDYYYLTYSAQAQDNKNIENEQSQKEIARYICNDYGSIRDENRPYATGICRSYSEYVGRQKNKILADSMGGISPLEAGKTYSLEEYESRKQDYYNKVNDFDFEQGFKDYMNSLGCKNEEELAKYIPYEEKQSIVSKAQQDILYELGVTNPGLVQIFHEFDYITENIDYDIAQQFYEDLNGVNPLGNQLDNWDIQANAVKNLLNSIDGLENKELYMQGIDLLILQRKCAYASGEPLDSNKLVDEYFEKTSRYSELTGASAVDALKYYLTSEIEAKTKELEELMLDNEQTHEKEQVNLTESFISTKIAQYRKS